MATTERTIFQEKLVRKLIDSLRSNIGLPDESLLTDYEKRAEKGIRAPEKLPRPLRKGEKVFVSTMIHHEIGLIYLDEAEEAWARPTEIFSYDEGKALDGKQPRPVRAIDFGYSLDAGYRYPLQPYHDVPMTVVRRAIETWEGPGGLRNMERRDFKVQRVLYQEKGGNIFSPYQLVCTSEYVKAPEDFVNPYGVTSQEVWVENSRIFESRKAAFVYARSGGILRLSNPTPEVSGLVESGKLPESLGEADFVLLSAKRSSHGS